MGGCGRRQVRALSNGRGLYSGPALTLILGSHRAERGARAGRFLDFPRKA